MTILKLISSGGLRLNVPITYTGKNVYLYGDSITFGYLASSSAVRYSTLLCGMLGATENNFGINNSVLEKRTPVNCAGSNLSTGQNMVDRVGTIPTKTSSIALLSFCFGMNDYGYNGANYTVANFKADYQTVIDACIAKGWTTNEILIISPPYPLDASFTFYDTNNSSNGAPTRQRIVDIVQACADIASINRTRYVDMYSSFSSHTPTNLVRSDDGVHPTDSGYSFMATTIYNSLMAA